MKPLVTRNVVSLITTKGFLMSNANQNSANRNLSQPQDNREQIDAAAASTNSFADGLHAITTAYSDYTKKSFEDTRSFVEKLSGVKSVDKAIELQTEFAKSAFDSFVSESQKIGALYRDLAAQSYKPFGGFLAKMTPTNR
jgi:hypothetical protein